MIPSVAGDLRKAIERRDAVLLVGAGVTISATGGAQGSSWPDLLDTGIDRCVDLGRLTAAQACDLRVIIRDGSPGNLVSAANVVTNAFGGRKDGEYARWLRDVFSDMQADNADLLHAIRSLDALIVTTNYDGLLADTLDVPRVMWNETARLSRVVRREEPGVIHLHGHWEHPSSVILGIDSYEEVLGDEHAQALLQALAVTKTLVLVGFGAGIKDPNLGALREWMGGALAGSEHRHYRLVVSDELDAARSEHSADERVIPLSYGEKFDDLTSYLAEMAPASRATVATAVAVLPPAPAGVRQLSNGILEVEVPFGYGESEILVNGHVAQAISRGERLIGVQVPLKVQLPLEVRIGNAAGVGPEWVVDENSERAMTPWHRVVEPKVPLYDSPSAVEVCDVFAVRLESFTAGRICHHYFPTSAQYVIGQYVTWKWDMTRALGEAYLGEDGNRRLAWSSSGFFDGDVIGTRGQERLVEISLRPREPMLRIGDRVPARVIATFSDDVAEWPRDITDGALLRAADDCCSIDVGPSLTALKAGRTTVTASYDWHSVDALVTVDDQAHRTEFLGGITRICSLLPSPYGLLIADQSSRVQVLRPNLRLEVLLQVNEPMTTAFGIDQLTVDDAGNIYMRAAQDRSILVCGAESGFLEVQRIRLPEASATPMALAWKSGFGLVIGDHLNRLWRWNQTMATPEFWVSVPVAPISMRIANNDIWILGGQSQPGLVRLLPNGKVDKEVLLRHRLHSASAFMVSESNIFVCDFGAGQVFEVSGTDPRLVADGLSAPSCIAPFVDGIVVGEFGGDSVTLIRDC